VVLPACLARGPRVAVGGRPLVGSSGRHSTHADTPPRRRMHRQGTDSFSDGERQRRKSVDIAADLTTARTPTTKCMGQ
jgi:hypothetical protein